MACGDQRGRRLLSDGTLSSSTCRASEFPGPGLDFMVPVRDRTRRPVQVCNSPAEPRTQKREPAALKRTTPTWVGKTEPSSTGTMTSRSTWKPGGVLFYDP